MYIPKRFRCLVDWTSDQNHGRFALENIQAIPRRGILEAGNGHVVIRITCDRLATDAEPLLIPARTWKQIFRRGIGNLQAFFFPSKAVLKDGGGVETLSVPFPSTPDRFPSFDQLGITREATEKDFQIIFTAKYLELIGRTARQLALSGTEATVTFTFPGVAFPSAHQKATMVAGGTVAPIMFTLGLHHDDDDTTAVGLIMPRRA